MIRLNFYYMDWLDMGMMDPKYKLAVEEAPLTIIIDFSPTSSKQLELIVVLFTRHFLHVMSRVK